MTDFDFALALWVYKSVTQKERDKADAYCGDDESFPLYKDGSHLAAAWDLAGHSSDPAATRECILRFAREHGLMDHLPMSARQHNIIKKAAAEEGDLAAYIKRITGQDVEPVDDADVIVSKALDISKAWTDGSGSVFVEGWISTETQDIERDVAPPEAFVDALPGYMALGGPLTTEHQMLPNGRALVRYPVGHVQKAALVRDGRIFAEASHPTDPADFEHFPGSGTGTYGRAVINDPLAGGQVVKGNVRGFSWVGKVTQIERLPGGGRKFMQVNPWRETTVAAFPINPTAVIVAAHKE